VPSFMAIPCCGGRIVRIAAILQCLWTGDRERGEFFYGAGDGPPKVFDTPKHEAGIISLAYGFCQPEGSECGAVGYNRHFYPQ